MFKAGYESRFQDRQQHDCRDAGVRAKQEPEPRDDVQEAQVSRDESMEGRGGTCSSQVTIGVPHDQGGQPTPINDGAIYNSTSK